MTDPAADMADYLLQRSRRGYQPEQTPPVDWDHVQRLVEEHLRVVFPAATAQQYAILGIPARLRDAVPAVEQELIRPDGGDDHPRDGLTAQQRLLYLGRKTILRAGCAGCHDIPGCEDAKTIGPGLAGWGRKDLAQLAFEQIVPYLEEQAATGPERAPSAEYLRHIRSGHRVGFLYQKLTEPRSYDYRVVQSRRYLDRLRMPQFPFTVAEREAVMTFVLGLVSDPPTDRYRYRPDARRQAVVAGRPVLDKYSCGTCHVLTPERWQLAYPPGTFTEQPRTPNFPFAEADVNAAEVAASAQTDHRGLRQAELAAVPMLAATGRPLAFDDVGDEVIEDETYAPGAVEYPLQLWQPAALDGHVYQVGESALNVPAGQVRQRRPSQGGFLAQYLLPHVVALEKAANPSVKGSQAWGWVPPPLLGEGAKVQPDWLHQYLLEPRPIRPASFQRMPRFNLSPGEATKLVQYFAAVDEVDYPHAFSQRRSAAYLEAAELRYRRGLRTGPGTGVAGDEDERPGTGVPGYGGEVPGTGVPGYGGGGGGLRFDHALRIVTNKTYCVACHIVADFDPLTSERAKAPNLAEVYRRLRPDYLRKWLAKPAAVLPYTAMSVNIPYDPARPHLGGVDQSLYHGTSVEQLDGVVDLLMNFDQYAAGRGLIAPLVGAPSAPSAGTPAPATPPNANGPSPAAKE